MRISDWSSDVCSSDLNSVGFSHFRSERIEQRADYFLHVYRRWLKESDRARKQENDADVVQKNPLAPEMVPTATADGTLIVVSSIGGNKNNESRAVIEQFKDIVGKPLPLDRTPNELRPVLTALSETSIGRATCRERGLQN